MRPGWRFSTDAAFGGGEVARRRAACRHEGTCRRKRTPAAARRSRRTATTTTTWHGWSNGVRSFGCARARTCSPRFGERPRMLTVTSFWLEPSCASTATTSPSPMSSACLEQGGPAWGLDLGLAHLTNLFGVGERTGAKVRHHRGRCLAGDISRVNSHWITAPPRTALDTASLADRDAGVAVLDWFLQRGAGHTRAVRGRLRLDEGVAEHAAAAPPAPAVRRALGICWRDSHASPVPRPAPSNAHATVQGLPPVAEGSPAGSTSPGQPVCLMLEFDGRQKYHRYRREAETLEQMVMREKSTRRPAPGVDRVDDDPPRLGRSWRPCDHRRVASAEPCTQRPPRPRPRKLTPGGRKFIGQA